MALTLPYPSMSFVPLDELHAQELNQIVANYTYIANQFPIQSTNLATSLQNLIAGASYSSGQQWQPATEQICAGYLTGNSATNPGTPTLHFSIPLNKNTSAISSVSSYKISGIIRAPARRLQGTASGHSVYTPWGEHLTPTAGTDWANWTPYVMSATLEGSSVRVVLHVASRFQCADANYEPLNNVPVSVALDATSQITFS